MYINDLPSRVDFKVSLFADDSMLYRIISTDESAKKLQTDLDCLHNGMVFNPDKCEVPRFTNKRDFITATYSIHGEQMQMTPNAKYLGDILDSKLSWNYHVDSIKKKANNTITFVRRNPSTRSQKS